MAHTAVLAQVARFQVNAFEHRSDAIMAFLVKTLLMAPSKDPVCICPSGTFISFLRSENLTGGHGCR